MVARLSTMTNTLSDCLQWVCSVAGDPDLPAHKRDMLAHVARKLSRAQKIARKIHHELEGR